MYDSLRDSYRVGDSIKLSGFALAYAGNPIVRAALTYKVYRESRFPYPWLLRYYPSDGETQMSQGESTTNENGKFTIQFVAQPEPSISRSAKPVYTYRIECTVTDLNGESRVASTTIAASYQFFE